MLNIGIIGYGGRVSSMVKSFSMFDIPYRVAAIVDPRREEIEAQQDLFLEDCMFYDTPEEMLARGDLHGVMIGTRCSLHADMACKVAARNIPLFLEKPVAINFDQLRRLEQAFRAVTAPVVVSFPLRLSPMALMVKEMIDSGKIGTVEHVIAVNDVPYGSVYYNAWYRDYNEMGGLFLQKATHDLDYINFLLDDRPKTICAMKAQRIYGGDKPYDLTCKACPEQTECRESPFNLFYKQFEGQGVVQSDWRMCMFSEGIKNEDMGNCIIEYEKGAQSSYTQNFFARNESARRGARLYGYKGTIDFDWYRNNIKVYSHKSPTVETIDFVGQMPHFGGDRELALDFLMAMRDGWPSRSPIEAGILSALTCLWARESAEQHAFCEVK